MSESHPAALGARFLLERGLSTAQSRVVWGKVGSSVGTWGLRGGETVLLELAWGHSGGELGCLGSVRGPP